MDFHEISYLCTFLQSVQKKNQVWLIADSGPGSSVGIATVYGLDGPGIESLWGWDIPHLSRLALGPTQPPVQWSTGSFPGVKSGRGVTLTPHPLLMLWSRKGRAIPLLPLWAVQPVQSLSACTRVRFTFTFLIWQSLYWFCFRFWNNLLQDNTDFYLSFTNIRWAASVV